MVMTNVFTQALVAQPPGLRDRIAVRFRAFELDRALADGAPPEGDAALALRARQLTGARRRRRVARELHRVVRDARGPVALGVRQPAIRLPVCRRKVAAADLERLARRLLAPAHVAARGVAQARLLLVDGAGPLYWRCDEDDLAAAVADAIDNLEVP